MSDHTPAPWVADKEESGDIHLWGEDEASKFGFPIANVKHDKDSERPFHEEEANARLISAAPDMLNALKDIHTHGWTPSDVHRGIGALIDKAEGRAE